MGYMNLFALAGADELVEVYVAGFPEGFPEVSFK